jgi:hypothetical protein
VKSVGSVRAPAICSGSVFDSPLSTNGQDRKAAIVESPFTASRASMYRPLDSGSSPPPWLAALEIHSIASRDGFVYGSGRSNTPSTTVNTAAAAPIPRPSVRTAASVKPAFVRRDRNA